MKKNSLLWEMLEPHIGSEIRITAYGPQDSDEIWNISVEDMDTYEVIFDTDSYDLVGLDEEDYEEEEDD